MNRNHTTLNPLIIDFIPLSFVQSCKLYERLTCVVCCVVSAAAEAQRMEAGSVWVDWWGCRREGLGANDAAVHSAGPHHPPGCSDRPALPLIAIQCLFDAQ